MSQSGPNASRWICLDVGETLIDETRVWIEWARLLDIPAFTFVAAIGSTIGRTNDHQDAFNLVHRPDWRSLLPAFRSRYVGFKAEDLYPDALQALEGLRAAGYHTAVIGNQPAERTAELLALGVDADVMAMSAEMGFSKPDPAFFRQALRLMGDPDPSQVAYVGDRLDNDVRPAVAAGLRAIWLRRGPWGVIGDADGPPAETALIVDSLEELVRRVDEAWAGPAPTADG